MSSIFVTIFTVLSLLPLLTANDKPALSTEEILSSFRNYSFAIPRPPLPTSLRFTSSSSSSSSYYTRINFGSCNKQFKPNPFWSFIQERQPFLYVWLGDIIYADTPVFLKYRLPGDSLAIATGYSLLLAPNRSSSVPVAGSTVETTSYREFIQKVPVVGVWDDHDFGTNDGDKYVNNEWKKASQQLLLDFLNEPFDSPRRRQKGVYTSYYFTADHPTQSSRSLKLGIILLDNRYHRDKYTYTWYGTPMYGSNQDILGIDQWIWLEQQLQYCQAENIDILIIGAGLQIIARGDPWASESWSKFPQSQAKLYSLLHKYRVRKVLFISGDVHISELNKVTCGSSVSDTPPTTIGSSQQHFYDLTSSGMTHSWNGPLKRLIVGMSLIGHTRIRSATTSSEYNGWYNGKNMGEIDIHWDTVDTMDNHHVTTNKDGKIILRVWGEEKTIVLEHTIPLRSLEEPTTMDAPTTNKDNNPSTNLYDTYTRICASAPLDTGLTNECRYVLDSCVPRITWTDNVYYFFTHTILIGSFVTFFGSLIVVIPYIIIRYSKEYIPGGIPIGISIMIAVYGGLWNFIESLH